MKLSLNRRTLLALVLGTVALSVSAPQGFGAEDPTFFNRRDLGCVTNAFPGDFADKAPKPSIPNTCLSYSTLASGLARAVPNGRRRHLEWAIHHDAKVVVALHRPAPTLDASWSATFSLQSD